MVIDGVASMVGWNSSMFTFITKDVKKTMDH